MKGHIGTVKVMGSLNLLRLVWWRITMINGSLIQEPLTMFPTPWSGSNKVDHQKMTKELEIGKQ